MSVAPQLEHQEPSPLASARLQRKLTAGIVLLAALAVTLLGGFGANAKKNDGETTALPPTWKLSVDVLNGGGDIYYTRALASKIGGLGYKIKRVTKAERFDYPNTAV